MQNFGKFSRFLLALVCILHLYCDLFNNLCNELYLYYNCDMRFSLFLIFFLILSIDYIFRICCCCCCRDLLIPNYLSLGIIQGPLTLHITPK